MKSREFNVPEHLMSQFAEQLAESELDNTILGTTEDGEVIVEVSYEHSERESVFDLMELLDGEDEE